MPLIEHDVMVDDQKKLEVLHDHYKETFTYIRDRERQRDKQFLIIIALIGLLFLETQYPSNIHSFLKTIKTHATEFDFSILPVPIITSVTWTVLFLYILRNCQISITIERQYEYLHKVECIVGELLGNSIYNREGRSYLINYPIFSEVVWIFYTQVFPILVILFEVELLWKELSDKVVGYHYVYDGIMAGSIALILILYRGPQLIDFIKKKMDSLTKHCT